MRTDGFWGNTKVCETEEEIGLGLGDVLAEACAYPRDQDPGEASRYLTKCGSDFAYLRCT